MKTLQSIIEEFDEEFPRPEWMKDYITDDHIPIASVKDIKSFITKELTTLLEQLRVDEITYKEWMRDKPTGCCGEEADGYNTLAKQQNSKIDEILK